MGKMQHPTVIEEVTVFYFQPVLKTGAHKAQIRYTDCSMRTNNSEWVDCRRRDNFKLNKVMINNMCRRSLNCFRNLIFAFVSAPLWASMTHALHPL